MRHWAVLLLCVLASCTPAGDATDSSRFTERDSLALLNLVQAREAAMIDRDLASVMAQFDADATFINGGGFYYESRDEISRFHRSMFENDSLTYTYRTGNTLIRPLGWGTAVVYYPWEQAWTMRDVRSDTLTEVGLMTLIAVKTDTTWKWKAVTNQRTREFFADLRAHKGFPAE